MKRFLSNHRAEIIIFLICFIFKLIFLFFIFYIDSQNPGIENSVSMRIAQPGYVVLDQTMHWHEPNDFHPPLYYAFTAFIKLLTGAIWPIFLIQGILISIAAVLVYKISCIYFSKKTAFWAAILFSIEPFLSFEMNITASEGLYVFLMTLFFYFFALLLENKEKKYLLYSGVILGLATLTRPTTLYFSIFVASVFIWYIFKCLGWKVVVRNILIFNFIFALIVVSWMARNKFVYGDFTIGHIFGPYNIYYYNVPSLISAVKKIPYQEALDELNERFKTQKKSDESANDFYAREVYQEISAHPFAYVKVHLIKTIPFFLQSGFEDILDAAKIKPDLKRPDITMSLLSGNFAPVIRFFGRLDFYNYIYFTGLIFWMLINLFFIAGLYFSFRNKKSAVFAFFVSLTIFYFAITSGTVASARLRLPVYPLFFLLAVFGYFGVFKRKEKVINFFKKS